MNVPVRSVVGRLPEVAAAGGLLLGYLLGGLIGAAVAGALIGGTAGLGAALWGADRVRSGNDDPFVGRDGKAIDNILSRLPVVTP
jgi:hypothetical protein